MDWSLVLISQGIETLILPPQADNNWTLLVVPADSERAFRALRQYQVENRNWPWPKALDWPPVRFDMSVIPWAILLMVFYWLSSRNQSFLNAGVMDSSKVVAGQWWRIFTAIMLHANLAHLAENLSIGVVLFGLIMGRFGVGIGLLAAYLAGAMGNVASLLLNDKPFQGLGASGMVMGALGLLAAQSLRLPAENHPNARRYIFAGVAAGIMMFALFGLTPGTDIAAHGGGFVSGLIFGAALVYAPARFMKNHWVNWCAGMALAMLIAATWRLALIQKM
jgi:rhomboid protease GluP